MSMQGTVTECAMSGIASFTKCTNCTHKQDVLEADRFGKPRPSPEVVYCTIFSQYRAARLPRSCAEFSLIRMEFA